MFGLIFNIQRIVANSLFKPLSISVALLIVTHDTQPLSIEPSELAISSQHQLQKLYLKNKTAGKTTDKIIEELDKEFYYTVYKVMDTPF